MWRSLLLALLLLTPASAYPVYYDIANAKQAQEEARARHLPLVWLGSFPECLTEANPERDSQSELTQLAMHALANRAVIVFFDGRNMAPVPGIVHAQFHIQDDGPLPNGASWNTPKLVFSNPDLTKTLGRVSATQLNRTRDQLIYITLDEISRDPHAFENPPPPPPQMADSTSGHDDVTETPAIDSHDWSLHEYDTRFGKVPLPPAVVGFLNTHRDALKPAGIGLAVLLLLLVWARRSRG